MAQGWEPESRDIREQGPTGAMRGSELPSPESHRPALALVSLGILPATRYSNPKNPHLNLKNPNPQYLKSSSYSECYYPNLFWVIRVAAPDTRTTHTSVAWVPALETWSLESNPIVK
jgi:hypothetical protein